MDRDGNDPRNQNVRDENKRFVLQLLEQFNQEIPNEDTGRARLYQYFEEHGLIRCPDCPRARIEKLTNRLIRCFDCNKQTWITAGTFFHGVRCVRPYLAALYLRENGAVFAASWFARLFDITEASGALIIKKIALVINEEMTDDAMEVHSAAFIRLLCRRSTETPARKHPSAELDTLDEHGQSCGSRIESDSGGAVDSFLESVSADEQIILDLLAEGSLSFDIMFERANMKVGELASALTLLELKGMVEQVSSAIYQLCRKGQIGECSKGQGALGITPSGGDDANTQTAGLEQLLASIHEMMKQVHGGVSRKCLQIYAALFWCQQDRARWGGGALVTACFRHARITYADIVAFVSPPVIRIWSPGGCSV